MVEQLFKGFACDFQKLEALGFTDENGLWIKTVPLPDTDMTLTIEIDRDSAVKTGVKDKNGELYTLYQSMAHGALIDQVRNAVSASLEELRQAAFLPAAFGSGQPKAVLDYMKSRYDVSPQFLWEKFPEYAVFRHQDNDKWFGLIMDIPKSKLIQNADGNVCVIDLHISKNEPSPVNEKTIFPGWHMNKQTWISVLLDDSLSFDEIEHLIDESWKSTK